MKNSLNRKESPRLKLLAACLALATAILGVFGAGAINKTEVYANSAQRYWRGSNSFGAVSTDGDCPLEVESEKLTFNVESFPNFNGENEEYNASVTAEYNFYNPADTEVTANLIFPYVTATAVDYYGDFKTLPKGKILTNGKAADVKDRFTYCPSVYEFNLSDLKKVRDFYDESGFFKRDLPVTRYSFTVTELDETDKNSPYAAIKISTLDSKKYALGKSSGYSFKNNVISLGAFVSLYDTIEVEVYGDGASLNESDWTFYGNGGEKKKINGKMTLKTVEQTTFGDLVFKNYKEDDGVSREDWFNAVTDYMISGYDSKNSVLAQYLGNLNINSTFMNDLMRWYEYDLTVPAHGRAINSVTAPLLPDVDMGYSPSVYGFTYLSSPAKTWKSFGTLTVEIKTPHFVVWDDEWTKTDGGYCRVYETLPDGEIKFSLSSAEKPTRRHYDSDGKVFGTVVIGLLLMILVYAVPLAVPVAVVIIIIVVNYKRSRNRRDIDIGAAQSALNGGDTGEGFGENPDKKPDIKKDGVLDGTVDGKTETEVMKASQNAETNASQNAETDASQNALKKENDEDELFE